MRLRKLNEMAMNRADAIRICIALGKKFVEHFDKIYCKDKSNGTKLHHASEMDAWWNEVNSIKMAYNNKPIRYVDLINWFFDAGALAKDFFSFEDKDLEEEVYDSFVKRLISENITVKELVEEMFCGGKK